MEKSGQLLLSRRRFLKALASSSLLAVLAKSSFRAFGLSEVKQYRLGEIGGLDLEATVEKRAICTYCSVGCGMIYYVKGNKPVFVEGDPDSPLNKGKLCVKGVASLYLFGDKNPLRLRKPLIRVSPKPPYEEILKTKDAYALYELIKRYRPAWREVSWEEALNYIAQKWREILEETKSEGQVKVYHPYDGKVCDSRKGCYFYDGNKYPIIIMAGAKLLNEEAYLIRKISMLLGSNNIDHDARRCHSSTVGGLAATFGFGAQTQSFPDTGYISVYLILGGNPAEAHPVSMQPVIEAQQRGTLKLVVVDPKFGRTASKADVFAFHRPGTDVAVLYYLLHYAFYERNPPIDSLDTFKEYMQRLNIDWEELKYFKELVKRYTAEEVSRITGIQVAKLKEIARLFVENSGVTTGFKRFASIEWAMGLTQHTTGVQNIRAAAIVQLALGNMGFPGGGVNPYRGHNNVQGTTDMCILAHVFPGYIKIPSSSKQIRAYQEWKLKGFPDAFNWRPSKKTCEALGLKCVECDENEDNCKLVINSTALLWSWWFMNWRKFELAMGIFVGTEPEDRPWDPDSIVISDLPFFVGYNEVNWAFKGVFVDNVLKGALLIAENIAVSDPNLRVAWAALSKMKLVVVVDVFETETAWFADVLLPGAIQYEKEGSITNSNRWLQWTERVVMPPGQAKPDLWIMKKLYDYLRKAGVVRLPSEYAGKSVERVVVKHPDTGQLIEIYRRPIKPAMDYSNPANPWPDYKEVDPELVYREIDVAVDLYNGMHDWVHMYPLAKRRIASPRRPSEIDGELDSGSLIHPGAKAPLRLWKNWGWCWPKNVRILYNLWTLEKTFGMSKTWKFEKGVWAVGPELDGATITITGETGEMLDAKTGKWRPAFVPGHNFYLGKFYKRAWTCINEKCETRTIADLYTGVSDPTAFIKEAKTVGKIVVLTSNGYKIVSARDLGIKYPVLESIYYDPELAKLAKASFKKPYFKGVKRVDGRVVKYVDWRDWMRVHDSFIREFKACVAGNGLAYRKCIVDMITRYGEWFAARGPDGSIWAFSLDYPMHYEPAETPDVDLATDYPSIAWRKPDNRLFIMPPSHFPELAREVALTIDELRREMPADAMPVIITTNRLEEHWHTGALSRNIPLLAEAVPEPFAEIPEELARKLGIKSGDIVEVGTVRAKIYLRAYVTKRMPKLIINDKPHYVINIPWHWGFAGMHNSPASANLLTPDVGDVKTMIQESKVMIGWVKKASPAKYVYQREPPHPPYYSF